MNTLFIADSGPLCRIYPVEVLENGKFCTRDAIEDNADIFDPVRMNNVASFLDTEARHHLSTAFVD